MWAVFYINAPQHHWALAAVQQVLAVTACICETVSVSSLCPQVTQLHTWIRSWLILQPGQLQSLYQRWMCLCAPQATASSGIEPRVRRL